MKAEQRTTLLRVLALVFVVTLTVLVYLNRDQVQRFEAYGYPGIFLISLVTNASLFLPLPGVLFTSAFGAVFNPFGVALAAGTGAALGELSGYLAGFSGQAVIEDRKWYDRLVHWMKTYGDVIVLFLAFFPNPLFDMTGLVAGGLKMPLYRFLFWTWIGKCLKMLVFALGGAAILDFLPF